jgi:UPF0042 nucleotide-binding protein
MDVVVIAGLSGAGRSTAAATLEDLGWFVIDNLPPTLIPKVADLVERPGSEAERVAFVVGRSGGTLAEEVEAELAGLSARGARVRVVFLEASDEALIRRFEGTRRRHPLDTSGVRSAIASERDRLGPLRDRADVVVDTSEPSFSPGVSSRPAPPRRTLRSSTVGSSARAGSTPSSRRSCTMRAT